MSAFTLESFDLSSLPCLPLSDKSKLPSCAAAYFALSTQGRVLYIGRSIDIRERLRRHHRVSLLEALGGVRIAWLEESNSLALRRIETALIKYFNPPLNRIPSFLREEDTKNLIKYLTFDERTHKSNVIPINKLLASQLSQTNELVNERQTETVLHSISEPRWGVPSEFKEVIVEQAERIKHLEKEIADLRLMFQEQMQAYRQLTEAFVEQAKVIGELSRTQAETNSRISEIPRRHAE